MPCGVQREVGLSGEQQSRAQVFAAGIAHRRWLAVVLVPAPPLDLLVPRLWYVEGHCPLRARLPPILGLELVFNLGDPYQLVGAQDRVPTRFGAAWIEGLRHAWLESEAVGRTALLGARLLPAGAYGLFGPAIKDLGNRIVLAECALGGGITALANRLQDAPSLGARFAQLEAHLRARFVDGWDIDPRVAWATSQLAGGRYESGVRELSRSLSLSHQRFGKIFHRQVGLTPKRYARIARFGRVVADVSGNERPDWTEVALRHGFFDQAHVVREFGLMAGCAPTEFLSRRDTLDQSVAILE